MKPFKKNYVTRDQIIKAILTEPLLHPGRWARVPENQIVMAKTRNTECKVCAVGSVLRHAAKGGVLLGQISSAASGIVRYPGYGYVGFPDPIRYLKDCGYWLSLLSCEFENRTWHYNDKRERKDFANWVKENFPKKISLKSEKQQ